MGAVGMAGDLNLLGGRQLVVKGEEQSIDFILQTADFGADVDMAAVGQMPQFLNFGFEFRDGFFKI